MLTWCSSAASVLSASDEVSAISLIRMKDYPKLGALIFGEGVLNDALSLVLFKSLQNALPPTDPGPRHATSQMSTEYTMVFSLEFAGSVTGQLIGSCVIGILCGLANALFMKTFPNVRRHPIHETSLVLLFGLLSYGIAETVGVSGILTMFLAAITLAHYSWYSLSRPAQIATKLSISAMSDIAEGFAFSYAGLALWEFTGINFCLPFAAYMLMVVLLSRFVTIFTFCSLFRWCNSEFDIPKNEQVGFGLGGVVRGSLCFAQILQVRNQEFLVTTTLFIVLVTSFGGGILLPIILPILVPDGGQRGSTKQLAMKAPHEDDDDDDADALSSLRGEEGVVAMGTARGAGQGRPGGADYSALSLASRTVRMGRENVRDKMHHTQTGESDGDSNDDSDSNFDFDDAFDDDDGDAQLTSRRSDAERVSAVDAAQNGHGPTAREESALLPPPPNKQYSFFYSRWVWLDEKVMKPLFGGSTKRKAKTNPQLSLALPGATAPNTVEEEDEVDEEDFDATFISSILEDEDRQQAQREDLEWALGIGGAALSPGSDGGGGRLGGAWPVMDRRLSSEAAATAVGPQGSDPPPTQRSLDGRPPTGLSRRERGYHADNDEL